LLLLARLGLRSTEIVHMNLEDIDWEVGELVVTGKAGRQDRLPLPEDVGRTLARYIQQVRPRCASRRVFIRMHAPHQGFKGSASVTWITNQALKHAGITVPRRGAHLLRHSLATHLLGAGASLSEIGKVLRHEFIRTTAIYAKVNLQELRTVAEAWPGGAE
jgi:site-specific recombinase XerD